MDDIQNAEFLGRTHLKSRFMKESLVSKATMKSSRSKKVVSIIPDANVVMIGGKSIMDRGKAAVFPMVDEIVENKKKHKLILGVSGGVRLRHTYEIGLDLGLPTGGLAMIAGAVEEQYATMLYALLAKHGGISLPRDCFNELPLYLDTGMIPILICMPPHHYWEKPPHIGIVPEYGSDFGMFMVSEVLGCKSMIFIKDQDGLYDKNPEQHSDARLISRIDVNELLRMDLEDLIVERSVLTMLAKSKQTKEIHIINGLKTGNLTKALSGQAAGSIIYRD